MRIKISAEEPIVFFVKVKGPRGEREFRAVLDTGSTECTVPVQDARALGYNAYFDPFTRTGEGVRGISKTDLFESDELVLDEIAVGDLVARNVKAITHELPRWAGVEGVIGNSFLQHFKTSLDFKEGYLTIEPV